METAEAYESVPLEKHLALLEQLKTSMDEVAELTIMIEEEKRKTERLTAFVNTLFNTWKEFTDSFLASSSKHTDSHDGTQEQYNQSSPAGNS